MDAPEIPTWIPFTEVLGLPLHPLAVHGAVVLLPLAALGLVVMGSSAARSKRYSPAVLLVAVGAAVSAYLARASGRVLAARLGYTEQRHFELGEWTAWAALGVLVVVALLALADRGGKRSGVGKALSLLGYLVALAAIGLVVVTGHLGAELTWG